MTILEKPRILITGHEGFIGSALVSHLKDKYTIIGIDRKEKTSNQDLRDCDLPDNINFVVHLAGRSGVKNSFKNWESYWSNNVEVTKRILHEYKNIRVLVASSSTQYEPHLNPYAATKHIIEKIPHTNACFMRLHTVYSKNPRKDMFIYKLLNGGIEYVSNNERDFIHVNDVVKAIELLLHSDLKGPIDVGTGISTKINNIIKGVPFKVTPKERKKTKANTTILHSLGFKCEENIEDFLLDNWSIMREMNPRSF